MKKDVFAAVRADDPHGVAAALEEDAAALDATGPGGQSPLMHAVLAAARHPKGLQDACAASLDVSSRQTFEAPRRSCRASSSPRRRC